MEVQAVTTYTPKVETPDPRVFDKNGDGEVNARDIDLVSPPIQNSDNKLDVYA